LQAFALQHIPVQARAEANKAAAVIGLRARTRSERFWHQVLLWTLQQAYPVADG